ASIQPPAGVRTVEVSTAEEMLTAARTALPDADALVMAAAVADFRPARVAHGKLKRRDGVPELRLEPTPDILAELSDALDGRVVVCFAAEAAGLERAGREELMAMRRALVVVNRVGR